MVHINKRMHKGINNFNIEILKNLFYKGYNYYHALSIS